ncbi:DUF4394 domain-containing protein [Phycisphaera mikurensis]|uniref:DUF4394 domain-containing protein n=1 Tax=Phycisphaera mikurensis (strain NBRC 102666 / KCTC 22515 / FYK2301M01) TaxID=1142394 RepID=I0IEZ5_PHYMF|nr:DUF4394 domain-containing protein [Phycisphaera mikurensis]MBB6441627.1 MYXO-CTERM domain-containing protein [Phycisphaera mikurensis]BAM03833.1 hypothetical protein PSMK_16740 [Phycisphaera mikurensis NBRC 102666]
MTRSLTALIAASTAAGAFSASAETVLVLEDVGTSQQLFSFDSASPSNTSNRVSVTGLESGGELLGIDYRPATGQLFGFSSNDRLYTLDAGTGAATLVGSGFSDAPAGTFYGFDFNPVIDKIRINSDVGTNFVADPDSGDANIADTTPLFYGSGDANEGASTVVIGAAYTNSVANADSTQLYVIDSALDILATQANNAGTLGTVGELGVDIVDIGEFDVSGATGTAYLAGIVRGETDSTLFSVDLGTGLATSLGTIGSSGTTIAGIAVAPGNAAVIPTPGAAAAGLALLGGLAARRKRSA